MSLKDERSSIANVIDMTAFASFPARITPPVALVQAGSPYLENGERYGYFTARWEVMIVNQAGQEAQDQLDDNVEDVIVELVNAGYTVESVSQPYGLEISNAVYPTVTITISNEITL